MDTVAVFLEEKKLLHSSSSLLPTTNNESLNSCLAALSMLYANVVKNNPFLIFEYLLKVGYLRNISDSTRFQELPIVQYAQYNHLVPLKECVGLMMGYMAGERSNMAEHIPLYALETLSKEGNTDRIDVVLSQGEVNNAQRCLGYMPLCALDKKKIANASKNYYSIFLLFAAIGQVLLHPEDDEILLQTLREVQTYRSYPMVDATSSKVLSQTSVVGNTLGPDFNQKDSSSIGILIENIRKWALNWPKVALAPYLLGCIAARFYKAVIGIQKERLGDQMHLSIVAFLNACLIEEVGPGNMDINSNNVQKSPELFLSNIKKVSTQSLQDSSPLTWWLMQCPMLSCFMDVNIFKEIRETTLCLPDEKEDSWNLFDILNQIIIKKTGITETPYTFSGDVKKISATIQCLKKSKPSFDIQKSILEVSDEDAVKNLKNLRMFTRVDKRSVQSFKTNYLKASTK
jgi:hypothetical protein